MARGRETQPLSEAELGLDVGLAPIDRDRVEAFSGVAETNMGLADERQRLIAARSGIVSVGRSRLEALLETTEVTLTHQALVSRWVYQLLKTLVDDGIEISSEIREKYLSWALLLVPPILAAATYQLNKSPAVGGSNHYRAVQDYSKAALGSAFLFILHDFFTKNKGLNQTVPEFVITTLLVPLLSIYLVKTALPDTTRTALKGIDYASLTAQHPSTAENCYNVLTESINYGLNGAVIGWTIDRELTGKTINMSDASIGMTVVLALVVAVSAFNLAKHPAQFDRVAAASKSACNGALSYSAMSGLFSVLLNTFMTPRDCNESGCDDMNMSPGAQAALVVACLVPAIAVAVHGYRHTHFRFEERHKEYVKITGLFGTDKKNNTDVELGGMPPSSDNPLAVDPPVLVP